MLSAHHPSKPSTTTDMGAGESRAHGGGEAGPPDYYALLEVEESATADEIRV